MQLLKHLILYVASVFLVFACRNSELTEITPSNEIDFSINLSTGKSTNQAIPKSVLVTIKDVENNIIYELEKLDLISFNDSYVTKKLVLNIGDYKLTEFLILDENDNVIYATPKEESEYASFVNDPLPIEFNISLKELTTLAVEIISTSDVVPAELGYADFSFKQVKTMQVVLGAYTNDLFQQATPNSATLIVASGGKEYINEEVNGSVNVLTLPDELDSYEISVEKEGYKSYSYSFSADSLYQHSQQPLDIHLEIAELVLDYTKIEDAIVSDYKPNDNFVNEEYIQLQCWTVLGERVTNRFYLTFDLSSIPIGTEIQDARLSLFFLENHPVNLDHTFGGENEIKVEVINSTWDISTVTWNNQPSTINSPVDIIPKDENGKIDKPNIDITNVVQALINNRQYTGIKFSYSVEETYKSSFFASTENIILEDRPYLAIKF